MLMLRGIMGNFSPACQSTMSRSNMYHGTVLRVNSENFPGNLLQMTRERGVEAKTKCVRQIVMMSEDDCILNRLPSVCFDHAGLLKGPLTPQTSRTWS